MPGASLGADFWVSEYLTPHDVWLHGVDRIRASRQTAMQEMLVVEGGAYGAALILDGKWQTCVGDEFLYHEPIVHAPCVLQGAPERVLIAGGADGGALREVLKWSSVKEAVVADIDGEVIDACRELLPEIHQGAFDDPRSRVEVGDAWDLIERTPNTWDVIIADLTDPIEEGPAFKLFTQEFFQLCRRALRSGGVFVNQAGSMSPPLSGLLSRVVHTMETVFPQVNVMQANVPTYGSPWGLAIARTDGAVCAPSVDQTDDILARLVCGPLRMFDGLALQGLLSPPRYIRDQVQAEQEVYTTAHPPRFFGSGSSSKS